MIKTYLVKGLILKLNWEGHFYDVEYRLVQAETGVDAEIKFEKYFKDYASTHPEYESIKDIESLDTIS